jgi:hypothetical protein
VDKRAMSNNDVRAVVVDYLSRVGLAPCADNSCIFGKPGGMATNGGCRCFDRGREFHRADRLKLAEVIRLMAEALCTASPRKPLMRDEDAAPPMRCDNCEAAVSNVDQHWTKAEERPDGFWSCHPDVGKCRCAVCNYVWKPREVKIPEKCPKCGERTDLFWADDGGWPRALTQRVDW